jgi:hypothetical protein
MRTPKTFLVLEALAVTITLTASLATADTCLKFKMHTDGYTIMSQTIPASDKISTTWISGDKARIEQSADTTILVHLDKSVVYFLDNKKKTYAELSLDAITKSIQTAAADAGASEEEQDGVAAMMQGMMSMMKITATVTPTTEHKKIGAWNCTKYSLSQTMGMAGTTVSELWASQEIKVDPEFYAKFSNFAFVKFTGFAEALQEYKKIKGVPVLISSTSEVMKTSIKTTQELQEAQEAGAPAGSYDIPKGYKKISAEE